MKNLIRISALAALSIVIVLNSCSEKQTKTAAEEVETTTQEVDQKEKRNFPNPRSPLAIMMRNIYNDLKAARDTIAGGGRSGIKWVDKYSIITTATPTDQEDSGPVFDAFAQKFLVDLNKFETATNAMGVDTYNSVIQSCLDCHQEHCHGPMPTIAKLKI